MITDFLLDERMFIYVVCINDGFYMEPDVIVYKVFLKYKDAKKCCESLKNKHRSAFVEKRRLYL